MSPVLAVTEPTALPIAIAFEPRAAPIAETSSSGRVVAKLTTVAPIINFGIPETSAIHTADYTKRSPPFPISPSPPIKSLATAPRGQPAAEIIIYTSAFPCGKSGSAHFHYYTMRKQLCNNTVKFIKQTVCVYTLFLFRGCKRFSCHNRGVNPRQSVKGVA